MAARSALTRFGKNVSGATAIEYAVLVACIGMAVVAALSVLQTSLYGVINDAATAIVDAMG